MCCLCTICVIYIREQQCNKFSIYEDILVYSYEVADQGSGSHLEKWGKRKTIKKSVQLLMAHTFQPPQHSSLQGVGRKAPTDCWILDSRRAVWLLSWSWNNEQYLHSYGDAKKITGVYSPVYTCFVDVKKICDCVPGNTVTECIWLHSVGGAVGVQSGRVGF